MKAVRVIFTILGWLLICFQALAYLGPILRHEPIFDETDVAYIIGCNFFVILGIGFLLVAKRLKKRITLKKEKEQLDSFLNESHNTESSIQ